MCNKVMRARVLEVLEDGLLVEDLANGQEVIVHYGMACRFCPGDCVCICHNGAMTMSIPPQISAICIRRYR